MLCTAHVGVSNDAWSPRTTSAMKRSDMFGYFAVPKLMRRTLGPFLVTLTRCSIMTFSSTRLAYSSLLDVMVHSTLYAI